MRVLFITWDAPEAAYLESLFLPIFVGLQAGGIAVDILQFRWGERSLTERTAAACQAAGLGYRAAPILRRLGGGGALASAVLGRGAVRAAVRQFGSDVLMPRSLMPALATLAAGADRLRPVIFDADGLAADERVEFGGLSPLGTTYRLLRDVEAQMVRRSASVMVRSARARDVLLDRAGPPVSAANFHVVTNGRDDHVFTPGDPGARQARRAQLGIAPSAPLIAYAGSVGPQYRFDRFGAFAQAVLARRPEARLLVLTGAPDQARAALAACGAQVAEAAIVTGVAPDAVPGYLACADLGTAFRQPGFSMAAVAPIKVAEYLLCGLPVVGTAAVGDTRAAMDAGVFFDEAAGLEQAAEWFVSRALPEREELRARARQVGIAHFSLARAVQDYRRAIEPVLAQGAGR
jgi:glycosyltransferase involved in cell wall biosynthesis